MRAGSSAAGYDGPSRQHLGGDGRWEGAAAWRHGGEPGHTPRCPHRRSTHPRRHRCSTHPTAAGRRPASRWPTPARHCPATGDAKRLAATAVRRARRGWRRGSRAGRGCARRRPSARDPDDPPPGDSRCRRDSGGGRAAAPAAVTAAGRAGGAVDVHARGGGGGGQDQAAVGGIAVTTARQRCPRCCPRGGGGGGGRPRCEGRRGSRRGGALRRGHAAAGDRVGRVAASAAGSTGRGQGPGGVCPASRPQLPILARAGSGGRETAGAAALPTVFATGPLPCEQTGRRNAEAGWPPQTCWTLEA